MGRVAPGTATFKATSLSVVPDCERVKVVALVITEIVVPAEIPLPLIASPTANPDVLVTVAVVPDTDEPVSLIVLLSEPFASTMTQPDPPGVVVKIQPGLTQPLAEVSLVKLAEFCNSDELMPQTVPATSRCPADARQGRIDVTIIKNCY